MIMVKLVLLLLRTPTSFFFECDDTDGFVTNLKDSEQKESLGRFISELRKTELCFRLTKQDCRILVNAPAYNGVNWVQFPAVLLRNLRRLTKVPSSDIRNPVVGNQPWIFAEDLHLTRCKLSMLGRVPHSKHKDKCNAWECGDGRRTNLKSVQVIRGGSSPHSYFIIQYYFLPLELLEHRFSQVKLYQIIGEIKKLRLGSRK